MCDNNFLVEPRQRSASAWRCGCTRRSSKYPHVRTAAGTDALIDEALEERAEAKNLNPQIQSTDMTSDAYDRTVKELGQVIDQHVLEERERIFLQARAAALTLRGLTVRPLARQRQLKGAASAAVKEAA